MSARVRRWKTGAVALSLLASILTLLGIRETPPDSPSAGPTPAPAPDESARTWSPPVAPTAADASSPSPDAATGSFPPQASDPAADGWDGRRFCGVPDRLAQRPGGLCRWPDGRVSYFVRDAVPGFSLAETRRDIDWAMQQIASACGLKVEQADRPETCRLLFTTGRIDGPGGTLAIARLPCGRVDQCEVRFDPAERWGKFGEVGKVTFRLVALHEAMHGVGVEHIDVSRLAVMNPAYSSKLAALAHPLQPPDRDELRRRYPLPPNSTTPSTPSAAPPPATATPATPSTPLPPAPPATASTPSMPSMPPTAPITPTPTTRTPSTDLEEDLAQLLRRRGWKVTR